MAAVGDMYCEGDEDAAFVDVTPCSSCGRNFNSQVLSRHLPICMKTKNKPRTMFNAARQRAEGTEIPMPSKTNTKTQSKQTPQKTSNWRVQHSEFVNTIRMARSTQNAIAAGKPLPPPPPPAANPDYISCPYCTRRFNESAAQKHIPFCKSQHDRLPKKCADSRVKNKVDVRTRYQPPRPKVNSPARNIIQQNGRYTGVNKASSNGVGSRSQDHQRNSTHSQPSAHETQSYDGITQREPVGCVLRTGRTSQTYSDARQLSAKQRGSLPAHRAASNSSLNSYNRSRHCSTESAQYQPLGVSTSRELMSSSSPVSNSSSVSRHRQSSSAAKFCHECGTRYPVPSAKYCCECGMKRVMI